MKTIWYCLEESIRSFLFYIYVYIFYIYKPIYEAPYGRNFRGAVFPISCAHCTHPRRDDQAEWGWVGWYTRERSSPIPLLTGLDVA